VHWKHRELVDCLSLTEVNPHRSPVFLQTPRKIFVGKPMEVSFLRDKTFEVVLTASPSENMKKGAGRFQMQKHVFERC
jgi:hypothetical protein